MSSILGELIQFIDIILESRICIIVDESWICIIVGLSIILLGLFFLTLSSIDFSVSKPYYFTLYKMFDYIPTFVTFIFVC